MQASRRIHTVAFPLLLLQAMQILYYSFFLLSEERSMVDAWASADVAPLPAFFAALACFTTWKDSLIACK